MKFFITGGAGFIGSNLAEYLIQKGEEVVVYDNLSLGKKEFIKHLIKNKNFKFIRADLLNLKKLKESMKGCDVVFHLAANSDISHSRENPEIDLKQGTLATFNVLEGMRHNNIKKIVFSSSSTVYGEAKKNPVSEDYGPLLPISLYGASKLACEGLISAYVHNYGFQAWIYRFANIVGKNGTHGVIVDFIRKLKQNPRELVILGNGKQSKPYLHVLECIEGMLFGFYKARSMVNVFNLTCKGGTNVKKIAKIVVKKMGLKNVKFRFTGGKRGWVGDVPFVRLDGTKMRKLGWTPLLSSDEAVEKAVEEILAQWEIV